MEDKEGRVFVDIYGRKYVIVECIKRGNFEVLNCYPIGETPVPVVNESNQKRGFRYEPYLDILDEDFNYIFVGYIEGVEK